jgi:hypothetical protein
MAGPKLSKGWLAEWLAWRLAGRALETIEIFGQGVPLTKWHAVGGRPKIPFGASAGAETFQ